MSNYTEYKDKVAIHPGYYIKEIVEESGLTQEDFARRLGTTPKNLSVLIRGDQNLSIDVALKLSRMLGTTVAYWLNLQQAYDEKIAQIQSDEELKRERETFKLMDYKYFRDNYNLPDYTRQIDRQIESVRGFLEVSSLTVLEEINLTGNCRDREQALNLADTVNANALLQIAINLTLKADVPKYDKKRFEKAASFAMTQDGKLADYLPEVTDAFGDAGVVLVALPAPRNTNLCGASKKVDGKVMLLVNETAHHADAFRLALFREIGHILNGNLGISFDDSGSVKT